MSITMQQTENHESIEILFEFMTILRIKLTDKPIIASQKLMVCDHKWNL